MHEHPENLRFAAEVAFLKSLEQLQNILAQERQTGESELPVGRDRLSPFFPDSQAMEDAAADLDAYFGDVNLPENEDLGC
jgi:hypothetical protein